jgi:hypothetical protein
VRPSKARVAQRVEEFVQIVLDGAEPHDLRQYVSERQAEEGSPWALGEGENPLSDRQIRRYAVAAEKVIAESCRTSRRRLLRRHLARRRNLYAKSVNSGDLRTALAVLADEARLLRLYDGPPARKPAGELPATPEAVVKLLAARLAALDQAGLPAGEHARLAATLGDALLRAFGAADLERQLAEIAQRLDKLGAERNGLR